MDQFEEIRKERGGVANIYGNFDKVPEVTLAHFRLNKAMLLESDLPLTRVEREILAVETSRVNNCEYCLVHHEAALKNYFKTVTVSDEKYAILKRLAVELSLNPVKAKKVKSDFMKLGFNEAQWQHAVNIVSYFNYTNRLAHALDIQLEDGYEATCN